MIQDNGNIKHSETIKLHTFHGMRSLFQPRSEHLQLKQLFDDYVSLLRSLRGGG